MFTAKVGYPCLTPKIFESIENTGLLSSFAFHFWRDRPFQPNLVVQNSIPYKQPKTGENDRNRSNKDTSTKLGCVVRMVIDSLLSHAASEPNDNRKDAPLLS